ncbi:MAG: hypothetical protein V2J10_04250 [Wenzhouxiangella sp.]|jgi:hypothetical protein|nr:hypothetical protein [Wenzhouxiangella sp.]
MRIIVPLLVTALWALAAIHIEGVWPPAQSVQKMESALALLGPGASDAAPIDDAASAGASPKRLMVKSPNSPPDPRSEVREFRIALPNLPHPTILRLPARPICG